MKKAKGASRSRTGRALTAIERARKAYLEDNRLLTMGRGCSFTRFFKDKESGK